MLLAEDILLLGLDDESGKISSFYAPYLNFAIAGALLMELKMKDLISIQKNEKKKEIIKIVENNPPKNDIIHEAFDLILKYEKTRKLHNIIHLLAGKYHHFRKELFASLVKQGILDRIEKKRLVIFKAVRHPMVDPSHKQHLLEEIQEFILDKKESSERILSLLALIGATQMIGAVFSKDYRKKARKKINTITESSVIGSELKMIIEIMSATITNLIISSAASTNVI